LFNEKLKKVAEDVNAEDGEVFRLVKVEVGTVHVGVGDAEKFGEDETGLIAGNGFAGGGKEVMEFGGNEVLPVVVGFGVGNGGVGKEPVADTGRIALGEDVRETLKTVEENRVETAEAEALGAVGLDAKVLHSDLSRWARSW